MGELSIPPLQLSRELDINSFEGLLGIVLVLFEGGLFNLIRLPGAIVIVTMGDLWSHWCGSLLLLGVCSCPIFWLGLDDVGVALISVGIRALA